MIAADGFVQHGGWQYSLGANKWVDIVAASSGLRVSVAPGEAVAAGQELIVIEAMKMELVVTAPRDGTVRAVNTAVGSQVSRNQTLVDLGE